MADVNKTIKHWRFQMNYTQNEKIEQVTDSTMVVGVDIGSQIHYARAFDNRGRELTKRIFSFHNNLQSTPGSAHKNPDPSQYMPELSVLPMVYRFFHILPGKGRDNRK